jgi:hypothetical protein
MRVLVQAGLVRPKRIKQWTFYRRKEDRIRAVKANSSLIYEGVHVGVVRTDMREASGKKFAAVHGEAVAAAACAANLFCAAMLSSRPMFSSSRWVVRTRK